LIEDDKDIAQFLKKALIKNSFAVECAFNGEEGLRTAFLSRYDLIILDIMLPKMNGVEVLKRLRGMDIQTPVILLTAKDSVRDIVQGLNVGADDYLVKPFSFVELLARVRAVLRRGKMTVCSSRLQVANLILELEGHRVLRDDVKIELTPIEYTLLEFFMRHPGEICTRTMILEKNWDFHFDTSTNVIDVHISHLRKKIDQDFEPKLLHTIKGVGYVLEDRS
jgi:DNA-binding response OmpR family regulator